MKPSKIYAENLELDVLGQFYGALEQDYAVKGALMADAHFGYTLPIGGVIATKDVIVPSWIGFDLGCGVATLKLSIKRQEIEKYKEDIFKGIYDAIPVGFKHNLKTQDPPTFFKIHMPDLPMSDTLKTIFAERNGLRQIGTLGGGNHFIEIGHDTTNDVWVVIHSGSRGIGHAVATHYMQLASEGWKARDGHNGLRTDSDVGKEYIMDMNFCLKFAEQNRAEMMYRIIRIIRLYQSGIEDVWKDYTVLENIDHNHNHAELKDGLWIHRKGATQADKDMLSVIPGNMRDGSFIVKGKGNPGSLNSSSHGAGRRMSRKEAKRSIRFNEFESSMKGIVSKVDPSTLDEAPGAYKDIYSVMGAQKDLVDVVAHIKPMINVKG